jgi:predicted GIY-YIG superfamily endonuclease
MKRVPQKPCWLYLIQFRDTKTYKLGITSSVGNRMKSHSLSIAGTTVKRQGGPRRKMKIVGFVMCEDRRLALAYEVRLCTQLFDVHVPGEGREFFSCVPDGLKAWFADSTTTMITYESDHWRKLIEALTPFHDSQIDPRDFGPRPRRVRDAFRYCVRCGEFPRAKESSHCESCFKAWLAPHPALKGYAT